MKKSDLQVGVKIQSFSSKSPAGYVIAITDDIVVLNTGKEINKNNVIRNYKVVGESTEDLKAEKASVEEVKANEVSVDDIKTDEEEEYKKKLGRVVEPEKERTFLNKIFDHNKAMERGEIEKPKKGKKKKEEKQPKPKRERGATTKELGDMVTLKEIYGELLAEGLVNEMAPKKMRRILRGSFKKEDSSEGKFLWMWPKKDKETIKKEIQSVLAGK